MKYRVDLTITGYIEVEADTKDEAREKAEEGYSLNDVTVESDEIDDVSQI